MRFPVGTIFETRGKNPLTCQVIDYWQTTNLAGEVVRRRYVCTHTLMGQTVTDYDVLETTIAMGVVEN